MNWYRVVLAADGSVLENEELGDYVADVPQGARVYFEQANSGEQAVLQARERQRLEQVKRARERKRANRAKGLCGCGREPQENKRQCLKCEQGSVASKARRVAKDRGEPVAPLPPKAVAIADRQRERAAEVYLETLQRVHRAWCRAQTPGAFTNWLTAEIKRAAAALK